MDYYFEFYLLSYHNDMSMASLTAIITEIKFIVIIANMDLIIKAVPFSHLFLNVSDFPYKCYNLDFIMGSTLDLDRSLDSVDINFSLSNIMAVT